MASAEKRLGEVRLQNVRLSFPHLWKKHASVAGGKEKYRASFLIDPNTADGKKALAACRAAIAEAETETFGKAGETKYKDGREALVLGDDCTNAAGDVYSGYEGMWAVSSANDNRVPVVDRNPSVALGEDDGKPYAGCYVNAVIRFYGVKGADKGGNGMFASLEAVQFVRDGEAFGAAKIDATAVFDDFSEVDEDEV
jgi:hypothetical protein